jgi:UDP-glucose 6-dehydrogenase
VPLRLTVLGTGYLGTAQAACLASLGFEVLGVDTDPGRIDALSGGIVPFHEPALQPLLQSGLRDGRPRFTAPGTELAWCPEFLREGHAVSDTLRPDRIVAGVHGAGRRAGRRRLRGVRR